MPGRAPAREPCDVRTSGALGGCPGGHRRGSHVNRVAIVSGAGEGIGRSCALALARDGADVALGARRPEQLEQVAKEVRTIGRRALVVRTDITVPEQARALVERAASELGRVDAVVNVAALSDAHTHVEHTDWE